MANFAEVLYYIDGNDEEMETLFNVITGLDDGSIKVNPNQKPLWIGNLVECLNGNKSDFVELRGTIDYYDELWQTGNPLFITTSEAWTASVLPNVLNKLFNSLEVYYYCQESGCEVYETNDKNGIYFDERYSAEFDNGITWETSTFVTKEAALDFLSYGLKIDNITEDKLDQWNKEHEETGKYAHIHSIKVV